MKHLTVLLTAAAMAVSVPMMQAAVVSAGAGSYTTEFPGRDEAGRNAFPQSSDFLTGNAATRPIPTNDWWSPKLLSATPINMFNYPMGIKPLTSGVDLHQPMFGQGNAAIVAMMVGLENLNAAAKVSDYSDWTVTLDWNDNTRHMQAITGIGMPMMYFTRFSSEKVTLQFMGTATSQENILIVKDGYNNARYAAYAPKGATWVINGNTATTDLAGKDYWTVALLPSSGDAATIASQWEANAFAFPTDTRASWQYDATTGIVNTTYTVTIDNKEGTGTSLMGVLPHQWANIAGPLEFEDESYQTVRGEMKILRANSYSTTLKFHGVIPTLPAVMLDDPDFSIERLKVLINEVIEDNGLDPWTDSYNDGQLLNRLVQTARIADEAGLSEESTRLRTLITERVQNWLSYSAGEVAFLFYYHEPYGTLLGYPAGHGQDNNINDHHFHWGYIIGAAAYIAQHDATWKEKWSPMIELLIRDAASTDRNDSLFPYQRSFSPYAGHCWANGFGSAGPGNDQESTSEAMQFHTNLLHWAEVTGNEKLRDQAVYMYVTEVSAANEYWFDKSNRNFASDYGHFLSSRVFTNGYDYENFWGGGAAGSLGIEIYPLHGGSFYLMDNPEWALQYWVAMTSETGILNKQSDPNIWYDTWWKFLAMIDNDRAISLYNDFPERTIKFGVSQAHTYQWLYAMRSLGRPNQQITATSPTAVAFDTKETRTYVAQNYSDKAIDVKYSDGFTMNVAAHSLVTGKGTNPDEWTELTDPSNPDNPDNPGIPDGASCTYTDTECIEGAGFNGRYTVTFTSKGNSIDINVRFEGSYVGLVPAWMWNYTNGFAESQMVDAGGSQSYKTTIFNCTTEQPITVAFKIAFAGGMAVTRQFTYTLGDNCESTSVEEAYADNDILLHLGEGSITAQTTGSAVLSAYSTDGRLVASMPFVDEYTLYTTSWTTGVYIISIAKENGSSRTFTISR